MSKTPSVAAYRLKASDINPSTCLGRALGPKFGDKRWYPAVYHETQCGKKVLADNDLCRTCQGHRVRFAADYEPSEIPTEILDKGWCGLVTETVSKYQHTAGTDWANGLLGGRRKKPVWIGEEAAKLPEREREAMAAAIRAMAKAIRAGIVPPLSVEEAPAPSMTVEETTAAPIDPRITAEEAKGEMSLIDGTIYWVNGTNVYKYDEDSEEAGDYVGQLTADETIDMGAAELSSDALAHIAAFKKKEDALVARIVKLRNQNVSLKETAEATSAAFESASAAQAAVIVARDAEIAKLRDQNATFKKALGIALTT